MATKPDNGDEVQPSRPRIPADVEKVMRRIQNLRPKTS
jgi:hypothetical protein